MSREIWILFQFYILQIQTEFTEVYKNNHNTYDMEYGKDEHT